MSAVPPVPVAAAWDPTSPQHAVIRAAINWRKRIADAIARGAARVEVWADAEDLALIEAVDALPHIGEPAAPVAADDLLVCGHRAPYGRGPKSVESPCGQCGTWRAYAGSTRAESALRPGGESGMSNLKPTSGSPEFTPRDEYDPADDDFGVGPYDTEYESVGWDLSFGSRINFGPDADGNLTVSLHLSDDALANAMVLRKVSPKQILSFAQHLLNLIGAQPVLTLPRTPGTEDF